MKYTFPFRGGKGETFGRCYSSKTGRAFIGTTPSKGKVRKLCESISQQTSRRLTFLEPTVLVERLNRQLRGWANYFRLGPASKAWRAVDNHVTTRLRQWLCQKHKVPGRDWSRFPDDYLTDQLGLLRLPQQKRNHPSANT